MPYTQEIKTALQVGLPSRQDEIEKNFHRNMAQLNEFLPTLRRWRQENKYPQLNLPQQTGDVEEIEKIAQDISSSYEHVVVLGTGGSSLGGRSLCALQNENLSRTKLYFIDNTDPDTMHKLLGQLPQRQTAFISISKSGSTVETLVQTICALSWLGEGKSGLQLTAITTPTDNPLRKLVEQEGGRLLDHDPALGGRYSVLSIVGLLPAAVAGLDIGALREGAAEVMCSDMRLPLEGAALQHAFAANGANISVLMPYCDRLKSFSDWYCQLWAESLGKNGKGSSPIRAIGAVDQHSQLQLWLGGARDKLITMLILDNKGKGTALPRELLQDDSLSYLRGHHSGDVLDAQQHATFETLVKREVPVRLIRIKKLAERELGALLMHYMLETIFTAHLLGVNAFDQPAVEESKILAREYLARR